MTPVTTGRDREPAGRTRVAADPGTVTAVTPRSGPTPRRPLRSRRRRPRRRRRSPRIGHEPGRRWPADRRPVALALIGGLGVAGWFTLRRRNAQGALIVHPVAWIVWATCAGLVAFTTTDPFYLGLVVAVSWFVYAAQRVPGPTERSFRVFAIAGLVTMAVRTALVFLGTVDAGSVAFAALEGARLADPADRVRHVQRRHRSVRRGAARAAALPRAGARRGARALDRAPHDLDGGTGARGAAPARHAPVGVAGPADPRGPRARDRHGGSRDARGEHGLPGARTRTPLALPARSLDPRRDRRRRRVAVRGRRVPRRRVHRLGGAAPVDVPAHLARGRPSAPGHDRAAPRARLPAQAIGDDEGPVR